MHFQLNYFILSLKSRGEMLGVRYVAPYLVDVFYDSVDALLQCVFLFPMLILIYSCSCIWFWKTLKAIVSILCYRYHEQRCHLCWGSICIERLFSSLGGYIELLVYTIQSQNSAAKTGKFCRFVQMPKQVSSIVHINDICK